MPTDLRPQSSTTVFPWREITLPATVIATSKPPGTSAPCIASISVYEPAWTSWMRGLAPVM